MQCWDSDITIWNEGGLPRVEKIWEDKHDDHDHTGVPQGMIIIPPYIFSRSQCEETRLSSVKQLPMINSSRRIPWSKRKRWIVCCLEAVAINNVMLCTNLAPFESHWKISYKRKRSACITGKCTCGISIMGFHNETSFTHVRSFLCAKLSTDYTMFTACNWLYNPARQNYTCNFMLTRYGRPFRRIFCIAHAPRATHKITNGILSESHKSSTSTIQLEYSLMFQEHERHVQTKRVIGVSRRESRERKLQSVSHLVKRKPAECLPSGCWSCSRPIRLWWIKCG